MVPGVGQDRVSGLLRGVRAALCLRYGGNAGPRAGGALPPLFTTAVAAFRVAESQALNTSGGT